MTSATVILNTGVDDMDDRIYSVPITYSHILYEPDNRTRDFYVADITSQHQLRSLSFIRRMDVDNCPSDLYALCSVKLVREVEV
jgi:hypothetical protein